MERRVGGTTKLRSGAHASSCGYREGYRNADSAGSRDIGIDDATLGGCVEQDRNGQGEAQDPTGDGPGPTMVGDCITGIYTRLSHTTAQLLGAMPPRFRDPHHGSVSRSELLPKLEIDANRPILVLFHVPSFRRCSWWQISSHDSHLSALENLQ